MGADGVVRGDGINIVKPGTSAIAFRREDTDVSNTTYSPANTTARYGEYAGASFTNGRMWFVADIALLRAGSSDAANGT